MKTTSKQRSIQSAWRSSSWQTAFSAALGLILLADSGRAQNLLKNPGFEEASPGSGSLPNWANATDSAAKAVLTDKDAHSGQKALAIPANASVEQQVQSLPAGAYLARCWIKSATEQSVTLLVRDPDRPWAAYACAEIRVPRDKWTQAEVFCPLDQAGSLTLTAGGMSKEFRMYHGTGQEMGAPILADDFELIRYEPGAPMVAEEVRVWDASKEPGPVFNWAGKEGWSPVDDQTHVFTGTPLIRGRHMAGAVRQSDGGLIVYALQNGVARQRCVIVPSPALPGSHYAMLKENGRTGLRMSSASGDRSYTAWFTPKGLITVETSHVPQLQLSDCHLRYGLLPSFTGTDLCYAPEQIAAANQINIPSTQWFVGLVDGNDSMLVAAWETNTQAAAVGRQTAGEKHFLDTLSIGTETTGFSFSFIEHPAIWHRETLNEDWLGEYVPVAWQRPFPARWMSRFSVSSGGKSSFRDPGIGYSFPIASAKTRMWGVWFEDWNHYPFFFDGDRTVFHFEKTFVPQGEALIYFLEPAATDLFSPVEILEQALGHERAMTLLDFDANQLRKLAYSTPDQFMFDRPVCATTTRLSKIKQDEKTTLGVQLATHLYEFIREIRGRVDQYGSFFSQVKTYLGNQTKERPELREYDAELEAMITKAQSQSEEIYATSLETVQAKIEKMKALLEQGQGDGFNCGNLDVRNTAGAQDDLCRRDNRYVMKLVETAAMKCGDSPQKAAIATYIWEQSRAVLRRPTRWEPRRTLYFFEP